MHARVCSYMAGCAMAQAASHYHLTKHAWVRSKFRLWWAEWRPTDFSPSNLTVPSHSNATHVIITFATDKIVKQTYSLSLSLSHTHTHRQMPL